MPNFSDLRQVTKAPLHEPEHPHTPATEVGTRADFQPTLKDLMELQHYAFVFNLGQLEQTMVDIQLRCTVLNLNLSPSTLFKPNLYSCPKVTLAYIYHQCASTFMYHFHFT